MAHAARVIRAKVCYSYHGVNFEFTLKMCNRFSDSKFSGYQLTKLKVVDFTRSGCLHRMQLCISLKVFG